MTTPVGVSGAVFLVPVQVSLLHTPSPSVTPTNLLYNLIATPGALARYAARGIIFIGYPNALYDEVNLTPIMRVGATATPIVLDYNGLPAFLIDASVFPGSSGSPVFLRDRGIYRKRDGSIELASRFSLLGIVAAVYSRKQYAELQELPARMGLAVQDLLDLGNVYKASAIIECVDAALARDGMRRIQQDTLFGKPSDLGSESRSASEGEA